MSTVDFSGKFRELDEIIAYFDSDELDIDESLKQFERGVELSKELKEYLEQAKNKVEKIKADFEAA